jgi:S1-C subfamily serine protease
MAGRSTWVKRGAVVAVAVVAGGAVGAAIAVSLDKNGSSSTVTQTVAGATTAGIAATTAQGLTPAKIYQQDAPGVVDITVKSSGGSGGSSSPFGFPTPQQGVEGEGAGFVLDKSGDIVTNAHVVDGASSIKVKFLNGTTATAKLVGSDDSTDVAVVHVDVASDKLTPLALGNSSAVEPGEPAYAIGSPYGLPQSISAGIVSGTGREIQAPDGSAIEGAIQTDAALNHGNSGGPLLDAAGNVVGLSAQIDSSTGEGTGVGFAIPVDTVKKIADQLIAHGSVQHAYMGVQIATIDAGASKALGLPQGVAVVQVQAGSPADKAGLSAGTKTQLYAGSQYPTDGDVITAVDGKTVATAEQLRAAIDTKQPGDKVDLTVINSGKTRTVTVTLGTRPS